MRIVNFEKEAKRFNISTQAAKIYFQKSLHKQTIVAIDNEKGEAICLKPKDTQAIIKQLNSKVAVDKVETDPPLNNEQLILVIEALEEQGQIDGIVSNNKQYLTKEDLKQMVIKTAIDSEQFNIYAISANIGIPAVKSIKVKQIIDELTDKTILTLKPYKQISINQLSDELSLPGKFTVLLLKKLIAEGCILGQLDMVNGILIIKQAFDARVEQKSQQKDLAQEDACSVTTYEEPIKLYPSNAWYLAPILLGLLGGLIGYIAVKDEDRDKANDLIIVGVIVTILVTLVILAEYSWIISNILG